jgi:lysozyme
MEIKKVSGGGLDFIIGEEGLILHPYLDSVKVPTIGVGCTYYENGEKVKMSDPAITKERAKELFSNLLKHYELAVYSNTRDDINQNQFDALVSLCFNIGVNGFKGSTLLKRVNDKSSNDLIQKGFQMWKNAGGKPILLARRNREYALYIK